MPPTFTVVLSSSPADIENLNFFSQETGQIRIAKLPTILRAKRGIIDVTLRLAGESALIECLRFKNQTIICGRRANAAKISQALANCSGIMPVPGSLDDIL